MASLKVSYKTNNNYSKNSSKKNRSNGNTSMSSKQSYAEACNNHKEVSKNDSVSKAQKLHISSTRTLPKLECVSRIATISLVETGIGLGGKWYTFVKESNPITKWSLTVAESSLLTSMNLALPALGLFNGPLTKIDKLLCKSLDIVEQRVPRILYLPPEMIYESAQDYVNVCIVKPVLKRADSVKQIGNAVLDSKVTAYAADTVDSVLDKADVYVDKYLPPDEQDVPESKPEKATDEVDGREEPRQHVVRAVQHADRLSRKLGRRLSRRTVQEAKALKEQTTEAINVLVYAAELIVTNPKLAYKKAKMLWAELSQDEPGNQARPETLEQLIALLTREAARRMVHLLNYASSGAVKLPRNVARSIRNASQEFLLIANTIVQKIDPAAVKNAIVSKATVVKTKLEILLHELQKRSQILLEQLALLIAGGSHAKQRMSRCRLRNNHLLYDATATINGVNQ